MAIKEHDTTAPVGEIVAALSKHGIPLALVEVVFANVREYLQHMRVYDPRKELSAAFIADSPGWNTMDKPPKCGERVIVALDNGQLRECVYGPPFNLLLPEDRDEFAGDKVKILAWRPLREE
jgi:hypothetical protein